MFCTYKTIKSKQVIQVVILYASTLIGIAIGILNSVINTRVLPAELYGDYRYVQNIIGFLSSLLLFGYFTSGSRLLAIRKEEEHRRRIRGTMCIILAITIGLMMLTMLVLYLANHKASLSRLFFFSIPLCGSPLMLNYINTTAQGDNHIGRIAIARVLPSFFYCIIAFLIYRKFSASPELMLILYNGIALFILSIIILSTKPLFIGLKESFKELHEENKSYGFNVYLGSLLGVSTSYLSGITLGHFCETNANVGFYTLALTIATPLSTLPTIIGTTHFKKFASQDRIDSKVIWSSLSLTFLSGLLFIIFIKYIVGFLYDDSYAVVSKYSSFLAVGMCFHGLGDMFNRYLGAHGQGKQIRNAAFVCGIIMTIGSIVLVFFYQINGAIITKVSSSLAYFIVILIYYLKYIVNKDSLGCIR